LRIRFRNSAELSDQVRFVFIDIFNEFYKKNIGILKFLFVSYGSGYHFFYQLRISGAIAPFSQKEAIIALSEHSTPLQNILTL
jgi:hypothetical protein